MATPLTRAEWLDECAKLTKTYEEAMTSEAKALMERMEEWALTLLAACEGGDLGTDEPAALMYQARDRIEQLEREKAVVSDLWEQQKEIALDYLADCNKAADRIEALEAALRIIVRETTAVSPDVLNQQMCIDAVNRHAIAALGDGL